AGAFLHVRERPMSARRGALAEEDRRALRGIAPVAVRGDGEDPVAAGAGAGDIEVDHGEAALLLEALAVDDRDGSDRPEVGVGLAGPLDVEDVEVVEGAP